MTYMFNSCGNLTTIYASEKFVVDNVTLDLGMFGDCNNLVGGVGTVYNFANVGKGRAKIDGGPSDPGYFTIHIANPPHIHKLCGVATNSVCTHTLVTDTHDNVDWTPVRKDITPSAFKALLQLSGDKYLYLQSNIGTEGGSDHQEVVITANVNICLNGFSMHNIRFSAGNDYVVSITNCQTTESRITTNTTNVLSSDTHLNIYGVNKNIEVGSYF